MCDESSPTSSVYRIELEVRERRREKKKMERERSLKNEARSVEPGGPRHVWSAGTAVRKVLKRGVYRYMADGTTSHADDRPRLGIFWGQACALFLLFALMIYSSRLVV
jgi:hypothetical protein